MRIVLTNPIFQASEAFLFKFVIFFTAMVTQK